MEEEYRVSLKLMRCDRRPEGVFYDWFIVGYRWCRDGVVIAESRLSPVETDVGACSVDAAWQRAERTWYDFRRESDVDASALVWSGQ